MATARTIEPPGWDHSFMQGIHVFHSLNLSLLIIFVHRLKFPNFSMLIGIYCHCPFLLFLLQFAIFNQIVNGRPRPMAETLQRAIERTKQFQSTDRDRRIRPTLTQTAIKQRQLQPIRIQRLDVPKLNRLLKTLDKAWVLPKPGLFEPVGSNFQYKKTCASIYRARPNACDQLGFGVMCFNFCFELGEPLEFKCEDASDSQFCKTHSNYDQFLGNYRKNGYRAKAYIHQQLTRCFMTSVCNGALLNTSLLRTPNNFAEFPMHLRALKNRALPITRRQKSMKNGSEEIEERWERHRPAGGRGLRQIESATEEADEEEIIGPKKSVPFWQRLLVRKKEEEIEEQKRRRTLPPSELLTIEEDAEEEQRWLERRFGKRLVEMGQQQRLAITTPTINNSKRPMGDKIEANDGENGLGISTGALSMEPIGFWNKFQPGKWFQSIHFLTNTG